MVRRRCRICREITTGDSQFCTAHRAQALVFSLSFGNEEGESETKPSAEESAAPAKAHRKAPKPAAVESGNPDELAFRIAVAEAIDSIGAAIEARGIERRWPQISVYFLQERLIARPYYSIIPAGNGGEVGRRASDVLTMEQATEQLQAGQPALEAFKDHFMNSIGRLKDGELRTLDLHIVTYARLLVINEQRRDQGEHNLDTFEVADGHTKKRAIDDDVRAMLRHERW